MWLYMIQAGDQGPVKIGHADDPELRLRNLQTAHYEPLRLLVIYPGGSQLEAMLHEQFAKDRIRGEWFHPTDELERMVIKLRKQYALAEEHGWCERCRCAPLSGLRRRYCTDRCMRKANAETKRAAKAGVEIQKANSRDFVMNPVSRSLGFGQETRPLQEFGLAVR